VEAPATSSDEPTTDAASDPAATGGATPGGPVEPGGAAPAEPTTNAPVAAEGTESTRAESAPEPAATPAAEVEAPAPPAPAPSRAAARSGSAAPIGAQGEHALFAALEASCLPAAVEAVRRLYHIARDRGRELQWGHGDHPAVTAVYDLDGKAVGVWSCYTDLKPSFVVNFEWLAPHVPIERLQRLADRLAELPSVPERLAGLAEAGYKRRLALAVNAVLAQPGAADVINAALTELLDPEGTAAAAAGAAASVPPPPPAAAGRK